MQFPGKLKNQTQENSKKPNSEPDFVLFGEFYLYCMLEIVLVQHPRKTTELNLKKLAKNLILPGALLERFSRSAFPWTTRERLSLL